MKLLTQTCLLLLCAAALCRAAVAADSPYIYGIHDHSPTPTEYLNHIKQGSVTGGWITATVAIGYNPNDTSSVDFSSFSNQGHTVICRLNNGYSDVGTIPLPQYYADFAQRCAKFVQNSYGCNIWLIGNETNLASEWPPNGGHKPYVSPQDYANCFRQVYNAIKAVRPNDKVITQALAPWGGPYGSGTFDRWTHDGNPLSWVDYMNQMLTSIKNSGGLDGISLHINSRGYNYGDIHSTAQVSVGGKNLYWSFYVYKDWINYGIPSDLYYLPLYATECNGTYYWKGGHPELPSSHYEPGWMQEIYAEINRWNQSALSTGKPIFRCVNMYRWCNGCDDWNIDGSSNPYKGQILSDLDTAVIQAYKWPDFGAVVDNSDAGFSILSGTWTTSTSASDKYGADYAWNSTGAGADIVKWTPNLPKDGLFEVYIWYPAGSNRAVASPYTVVHKDGSQTINVNQSVNGGKWNLLGTFPFLAGSSRYVTLSDNAEAGKVVVADAVKWVYNSPLPVPGTISGTVRDRNNTAVSGATVSTSTGGYTTTSAANGTYTLSNVNPGTYTVTASKLAYSYQTVTGVNLAPGGTTTQDFTLTLIGMNLMWNGNFESGFQANGTANYWTSWTSGWSNPITFADSTSPVRNGSHAQKWGRADNARVHGGICQAVSGVTSGRQYTIDGYIRFQSTDPGAWAEVGYDLTGQTTNGEAATVQYTKLESGGQNVWLRYNLTVTATSNKISVFLKFGQYNQGGAGPNWAYADDFSIYEVRTPPVMISVGDDGVYQTDTTAIHGTWSASDPESGIHSYHYAISTTTSEANIITGGSWASAGVEMQATRSGLSLQNGQTYYILVKARNPHNQYSDVMVTDGIRVVESVPNLVEAKKKADGRWIVVPGLVCSHAPSSNCMAVKQPDNMVGIKVTTGTGSLPGLTIGTPVTVMGRMANTSDTREITDVYVQPTTGSLTIRPLFMLSRDAGGADFFYNGTPPISGQKGSAWGIGANTVGLMATVCGKTTSDTGVFYVNDGVMLLPVTYAAGITPPAANKFVKLTGLVETSGLYVISQSDIVEIQP